MFRGRVKRIHFVGIGGSGMNGIAEVLLNMGYTVTGSDMAETDTTRRLVRLGAIIHRGHAGTNVHGADCVVYSTAIRKDNPELMEAALQKIPIIPRAEMLSELMRMKYGVAVAGTHGKTTTTSMIASILAAARFDPTVVTGGKVNGLGANAKLGGGDFLVAEADESDGSFLKLSPTIAVVTNIDREHMDHYPDMDSVMRAYLDFMNKVPFYGCAVVCLDHPAVRSLMPSIARRSVTYGLSAEADIRGIVRGFSGMKTSFDVYAGDDRIGGVTINLPGEHNVYNSLAAISVARELGIGFEHMREGLEGFRGVERRFHIRGEASGVMVVDDYGHHPAEIRATLAASKKNFPGRRVVTVFQPHRFTRTKDLFEDFLTSFNDSEKLILTEVYAAGEDAIEGMSAEALCHAIRARGHGDVSYIRDLKEIPGQLEKALGPGDIVITLGAGDVWKVSLELLGLLEKRESGQYV